MKLDESGYKLIQEFEGLSLVPYLCSAKVATIGYGNTFYPSGKKVTMQDQPISLATGKIECGRCCCRRCIELFA